MFPLKVTDLMSPRETLKRMPPQRFQNARPRVLDFAMAGKALPGKLPATAVCTGGITVVTEEPSQELSAE